MNRQSSIINFDSTASSIPQGLKADWINLAGYGLCERKLARVDGYLNGNRLLDETTMDASIRLGNIFPDSSHPSYFPLQNYIFAKLHERYHQATPEEKEKIVIVTSNLFFKTHKKILDKRMQAIGENWENYIDNDYREKVEIEAVKKALDYIPGEGINVAAIMATNVKNAQLNFISKIIGKNGYKRNFVNPSSMDEVYDDGAPLCQFSDSNGSVIDQVLQKEIDAANIVALQTLNSPPQGLLASQEQEFLSHYMKAINAEQEPDMRDIAERLSVGRTTAYNIKDAVFRKIQAYVIAADSKQDAGTEGNLNNLQRLGRIKKVILVAAGLTAREWEIVNAVTSMPEEDVSYDDLARKIGLKNSKTLHHYVTYIYDKIHAVEQKHMSENDAGQQSQKNVFQKLKIAINAGDLSGVELNDHQRELVRVIANIPYEDLNAKQIQGYIKTNEATIRYHAKAVLKKIDSPSPLNSKHR